MSFIRNLLFTIIALPLIYVVCALLAALVMLLSVFNPGIAIVISIFGGGILSFLITILYGFIWHFIGKIAKSKSYARIVSIIAHIGCMLYFIIIYWIAYSGMEDISIIMPISGTALMLYLLWPLLTGVVAIDDL